VIAGIIFFPIIRDFDLDKNTIDQGIDKWYLKEKHILINILT
jgi:hypothetical protein